MIDRRTFIKSAPVTMAATASIADGSEQGDYSGATERAEYFASIIGREAPTPLTSDDGAPSPELLAFCSETGMSLDWVFLDDLKPMVLASYRDRNSVPADGTPIEALFSRWEAVNAEYNQLSEQSPDRDHEREFVDPAYLALVEIEDEIMEQPIEGRRDLAIKVVIALRVEGAHDDEQYRTLNADALRLLSA